MTVTIGARGRRSFSSSSSSVMASDTSALTYSVLKSNSSATRLMVSASRRWLMDTMIPTLIQVPITWLTDTFIMLASSLTVTNSVSFSILLSALASARCSFSCSCTASRFSLRYLAPFLFCPLLVRRANVSFTWRATSSSFTSNGLWLRLRFFFLGLAAFSCLASLLFCFTAWSMFTRSLVMRERFFFPSGRVCAAFSSRSLRRSSFDFFFGRVLWFKASRSILPRTFTFGASFFSLFKVKILPSSLVVSVLTPFSLVPVATTCFFLSSFMGWLFCTVFMVSAFLLSCFCTGLTVSLP